MLTVELSLTRSGQRRGVAKGGKSVSDGQDDGVVEGTASSRARNETVQTIASWHFDRSVTVYVPLSLILHSFQ